jgi:uncharacterized protein (TIGR02266 family)
MPKGSRLDNPRRSRALVNPESGAHARITPIDTRRAEEFAEPDATLVALATATEEVELTETRASLRQREETIESLQERLQQLEQELQRTRESLRDKDVELHSLRAPGAFPVSDSLRAMAGRVPYNTLSERTTARAAPASIAPASTAPASSGSAEWKPASAGAAYPVLQHVAVALRASTLPPSAADSIPPSQRRAPRKPCEIELEFTEETQFFTGLTQDISEGGVFIATYQLFAIGSRLELSFELPDGTRVHTWGRVRWIREESAGGCRPGMGVEFGELSEAVLRAITQFCEQRPPLYMEL